MCVNANLLQSENHQINVYKHPFPNPQAFRACKISGIQRMSFENWPESQNLSIANLVEMSHRLLVMEFLKEKSESSCAAPGRNQIASGHRITGK